MNWIVEFSGDILQASLFSFQNCLKATKHRPSIIGKPNLLGAYYRGTDKFLEIEQFLPSQVFSYVASHSGVGQAIFNYKTTQQVSDYLREIDYLDRCRFN